ncbi:MAG: AAA-like domain-containing protein, partial [Candidatus Desantisbacteria bacterium]
DMYLRSKEEKSFSIYSIGLVGVKNIRELNFGSTSPFNIATQVKLESFTLDQCYELINQYIEEVGHKFQEGVIEKIHFETGGHPFLTNRLCAILVEEVAMDKTIPVTQENLHSALSILLKEQNTNFDSLKNNAKKYEESVKPILLASRNIEYRPHSEANEKLIMYGIIKDDNGLCEISNPIYKKVLLQYFSPESIESTLLFPNGTTPSTFIKEGEIDLKSLLVHFKEFVERVGVKLFDIVSSRKESAGQYLLMSYLDLFIRTLDGYSIIETPSGRGRIDVLLHYNGRKYVVELKIWRGKEYFEKGKKQLIEYLRSENLKQGYLVLFDPREKGFKDFKENQTFEDEMDGYGILSLVINI